MEANAIHIIYCLRYWVYRDEKGAQLLQNTYGYQSKRSHREQYHVRAHRGWRIVNIKVNIFVR